MSHICLAFFSILVLLSFHRTSGLPATNRSSSSAAAAATSSRINKRSSMSGDHYLVPLEIQKQCCSQNYDCCKMIMTQGTQIKKAKECIKENHLELVNGKCPMSGKKLRKKQGRDLYCTILNEIDEAMVTNIIPKLAATNSCIAFTPNGDSREPAHFIQTVKKWLDEMRDTHDTVKCCFEQHNSTKTEEELIKKFTITKDTESAKTPEQKAMLEAEHKNKCNNLWSDASYHLSLYMKTVQMLESLGRKVSCLRGCVGEKSVLCVEKYI